MQEVLEVGGMNLGTPRSPVSISTDSSRRDSLRTALPAKITEPLQPPSSPDCLSRKRAASLDLEAANHPRLECLALDSASIIVPLSSDALGERVCLCQPDPKIPRPRNAFILYRQHYQAQVVAQHPGLANPEISKIIGEQWREQGNDVKNLWKKLAEEEKLRHQRQHPGYRYQPRRSAKGTGGLRPLSTPTGDDPIRCPKCHGRYISTPSTPLTPFTSSFGNAAVRSQPPFTPSGTAEVARPRPPYSAPMQNTRMDTRGAPPHPSMVRRLSYAHAHGLPTHHEQDDKMEMMSPAEGSDLKRRRYNQDSYRYGNERAYASSPGPYSAPQIFARNNAPSPMSVGGYHQQQHLPPASGMLTRPVMQQGSMGPPAQHISQPRHVYTPQSATLDESLRLPPLQTQLPVSSSAGPTRSEIHRNELREAQAKSIEAMVMTIPYINKIKVLAKISPPLVPPGPTSPAVETRGAVIVVEGSDKELRTEVGAFIEDHLRKDPSFAVKTWNGPLILMASIEKEGTVGSRSSSDTVMLDGVKDDQNPFTEYLNTISDWHTKSLKIKKHISSSPSTLSESVRAPKTIPIALVPSGFSLTTSDAFALKIPINDSYAPVDHWQWMATMWRGIVGPDLTVYVSKVGREEMSAVGGVEIRRDCQGIVVRVEDKKGGEGLSEKTKRRLGFEVLEFVRSPEMGVPGRT